jgi:hypothetical protein
VSRGDLQVICVLCVGFEEFASGQNGGVVVLNGKGLAGGVAEGAGMTSSEPGIKPEIVR